MRATIAAVVLLSFLLALPAGALAQGGNPFAPLQPAPQAPPPQPKAPEPPKVQDDDPGLGTIPALVLAAIAVLLIGGLMVAIAREGRGSGGSGRRKRRRGRGKRPEQPGRTRGAAPDGRPTTKAPPPPPRKKRSKGKRR